MGLPHYNGTAGGSKPPALPVSSAAVACANTFITMLVSFGLQLSAEQLAAVTGTLNSAVVLLVAVSHWRAAERVQRLEEDLG